MRCAGGPHGAHPRWRGADHTAVYIGLTFKGSSPLARGGQRLRTHGRQRARLIPAGAGRTRAHASEPSRWRAHPRWRGADVGLVGDVPECCGSSPLARGGQPLQRTHPLRRGLIPAGAGRTACRAARRDHPTAHPRWRGADRCRSRTMSAVTGSSPLARGGLQGGAGGGPDLRLIPAGAGRTSAPESAKSSPRAHPRWRGADVSGLAEPGEHGGSSPLARGGRRIALAVAARAGLIPAGAGRTEVVAE